MQVHEIVLTSMVISIASCDFFDNYVEVSPPPPESLGALPKCGEGSQRGKFKCVPYFNCDPSTNTIVAFPEVDGSDIAEPRLYDPLCPHYLQVCCEIPNGTSLDAHHGPAINLNFEARCGSKNRNGTNDAGFGEFPWVVGLFNGSETRPFCGGSLLSPVAVLTAAHCIEHFQNYEITVRAGEWDLESTNETMPHQDRIVSEVIIHEHYLSNTLYNDIAILILNSSLSQAENLGTICLTTDLERIDQEECFVSGWGQLNNASSDYPNILKKIRISTMKNKNCEENLKREIGNDFLLDRSFLCGQENSSQKLCKGDGGGPLVCPDPSQHYFQTGIVSWGVNCDGINPGVYTNVALFKDWIDFKLVELGYSSNSYTAT